jgi:DNA polymerase type B, organellar and viral
MIEASIKYLIQEKYNKYLVYLHNFLYFDSIFIIKSLSKLSSKIKPILKDGRFIDFECIFNKLVSIKFRDSLLLLPLSLSKLSKIFNYENKDIFPYTFVNNKNIDLNYNGKVPRFKIFNLKNNSFKEYNDYISSFKFKK